MLAAVIFDDLPFFGKCLVVIDQQGDAVADGTSDRFDGVKGSTDGVADQ